MNSQNNQITSPSKKNDKKIRSSHGPNDTHITLYLPPTNRRHVPLESIECADPRFKEEINKHINNENFLDTDIGQHLEKQIIKRIQNHSNQSTNNQTHKRDN